VDPLLILYGSNVVVPSVKLIYTELGPVTPVTLLSNFSFKVQKILY
jgi:hypothetical protein